MEHKWLALHFNELEMDHLQQVRRQQWQIWNEGFHRSVALWSSCHSCWDKVPSWLGKPCVDNVPHMVEVVSVLFNIWSHCKVIKVNIELHTGIVRKFCRQKFFCVVFLTLLLGEGFRGPWVPLDTTSSTTEGTHTTDIETLHIDSGKTQNLFKINYRIFSQKKLMRTKNWKYSKMVKMTFF